MLRRVPPVAGAWEWYRRYADRRTRANVSASASPGRRVSLDSALGRRSQRGGHWKQRSALGATDGTALSRLCRYWSPALCRLGAILALRLPLGRPTRPCETAIRRLSAGRLWSHVPVPSG